MPLSIQSYLAFVASVVVLCLVPGPDMAYLLGRTVTQGRRAGIVAAVGINAGAYVHVGAAVLGLSAILATSTAAFSAVKIAGAAYLIWIGIRTFASASRQRVHASEAIAPASARRIFWEGFLSDVLNPKVSIFFLAFLPQFVDRTAEVSVPLQLLFLGVTGNVVAICINLAWVMMAGALTERLRSRGSLSAWLERLLGALFVALGLRLATEKL